jgi:hypothetical protein
MHYIYITTLMATRVRLTVWFRDTCGAAFKRFRRRQQYPTLM